MPGQALLQQLRDVAMAGIIRMHIELLSEPAEQSRPTAWKSRLSLLSSQAEQLQKAMSLSEPRAGVGQRIIPQLAHAVTRSV